MPKRNPLRAADKLSPIVGDDCVHKFKLIRTTRPDGSFYCLPRCIRCGHKPPQTVAFEEAESAGVSRVVRLPNIHSAEVSKTPVRRN